jgi:hypothetical protein
MPHQVFHSGLEIQQGGQAWQMETILMPDVAREITGGTVKGNVEILLRRNSDARNSDSYLYYLYVHEVLGVQISYAEWQKISQVSFESVRRCRQKFQEEGQYLPTDPEVARQRKRNEETIHDFYGREE